MRRGIKISLTFLAVFILFSACPVCSQADQPGIDFEGKKIRYIDIIVSGSTGGNVDWESIARDMIPLKQGDCYSHDMLMKTIEMLSESNLFQSIRVPDPIQVKEGLKLSFMLSLSGRIKDIRVKGAFPVFKKEVLNIMTLYIGDAFSKKKLLDQVPRIKTLFEKQGYLDPEVSVSGIKDNKDGQYLVDVHIEKKHYFKVRRLVFEGNRSMASTRLELMAKTGTSFVFFNMGGRFIQKDLDNDIKHFIHFYREKGFADVTIKADVKKDLAAKAVDVTVKIFEGPLYKIGFSNNNAIWNDTLKKSIVLFKEGNLNGFGIKKSIRNIKKLYAIKGFPDADVDAKILDRYEENGNPIRDITFNITEGKAYVLSSVHISGNKFIPEPVIRQQLLAGSSGLLTHDGFSEKKLDEDINAVKVLYLKEGFTRARIKKKLIIKDPLSETGDNKKSVRVELIIDEGPHTRIGAVHFNGLLALSQDKALKLILLKPGLPFRQYMIANDEGALKKAVSEMGYPHVQVKTSITMAPDRSSADLTYNVEQGPYVKIGQIIYTGNFRTKPGVLDNEMDIFPEDPLSLTKLLKSRRNLMNMNALDSVRMKPIGLVQQVPEVDLVVEVEEKKPYFFETGAGYDTRRHVYVDIAVGDHNFTGRNLDFETQVEVSQIGNKGSISLLEPRLFSSRISSATKVFTEKTEEFNMDFGTQTFGVSQEIYRIFFKDRLTLKLGAAYVFHEQYLKQPEALTPEQADAYEARSVLTVTPSITFRTTDSYVRPRKGMVSTASADISKGYDNSLDDFIKYRLEARYYYTLFEPLTLAVRGKYGLLQSYGNSSAVPEDQLFFLGGTSSVRGFDENLLRFDTQGNALGGREILMGSLEARIDVLGNWELTGFYDMGALRQTTENTGSDDFRSSVGIGIRYMTPIGPIGLLYGWKLDPLPNESPGSFHFSVGYTF